MASALERAARAVAGKFAVDWDGASDEQKESAADVVRAVLMAVREPDEVVRQRASEIYASEPTPVFSAMIDAILNEKDTTND